MPVVLIGAVAIIGAATTYDNEGSYGDYSNYSDYDNYSDAAERKKRRAAAMQEEIDSAIEDLDKYKDDYVNPRLASTALKQTPAMKVSGKKMDADAQEKIQSEMQRKIDAETSDAKAQIAEIDKLLGRIKKIQTEETGSGSE